LVSRSPLETTIFAQNVPTAPVLLRAVKESDGSGGNGAQRNSRVHRSPRDDERIYTARRGCDAFGHSYKGSTHGNCDLRNSERQLRGSNGLFELIFGNRN